MLEPLDTCIVAGDVFRGTVRATDPDGDLVTVTAAGSGIIPPATFTVTGQSAGLTTGSLVWGTECGDVRETPYQVVFRATDVRPNNETRLADLQPWNIRVVGPAPQNLSAASSDRSVRVSWDPYLCQNAESIRIYRREGPSGFVPDVCQTGVPASTGYVLIAEVGAGETSFLDNDGGGGLRAGTEYCYIVYATFPRPGRGESLASNEACVVVDQDIPYLTNVTVDATDASQGQITVRWTPPRDLANLTRPLEYRLYRRAGPGFAEVFRSQGIAADTFFVDRGLNTAEEAYRYRLEFYQAPQAGAPPTALRDSTEGSSVRLSVSAAAADEAALELSWTYEVPWDNSGFRHYIYREVEGQFTLIDSVEVTGGSGAYTDRVAFGGAGLPRGQAYCYYVVTQGAYGIAGIPSPLLNSSQRACAELPRLLCPPVLSVDALDCEAFLSSPTPAPYQNVLTWVPQVTGDCTDQIAYYTVYFRESSEEEYVVLGTTTETRFVHGGLSSFAGCYAVTATDASGRESALSNEVCKDNCLHFGLPNVITPNGDGRNDVFRPDDRTVFVRSARLKVYNRWGVQVYEGESDPYMNWGGVDGEGARLSDGTYYYEVEVEFYTVDPT
ncbi:gliding motility-associated C-terminal domain-containing protein, partial [Pontibacter silvestris]